MRMAYIGLCSTPHARCKNSGNMADMVTNINNKTSRLYQTLASPQNVGHKTSSCSLSKILPGIKMISYKSGSWVGRWFVGVLSDCH